MNNTMRRRVKRAVVWGLAIVFLGLAAGAVANEGLGGGETDICKRAIINCLSGSSIGCFFDQWSLFLRLEYCLAGYVFCQRYVVLYI
jgi:hypothetical protein